MTNLVGPRIEPSSAQPRQLIVFLHGYCADGDQLIKIGERWRPLLPDTVFVAPNAPEACATSLASRQWFPLTTRDPAERWRGVKQARPGLDEFLDDILRDYGLDDSRLGIVGFSQGAEMALHVGLRRTRAPAAIVGFSGILVGPEYLGETMVAWDAGARPRVLLIHGSRDDVIPVEALFLSASQLASANIPCEWHLSVGIGHEIDETGLRHCLLFIAECFGLKLSPL